MSGQFCSSSTRRILAVILAGLAVTAWAAPNKIVIYQTGFDELEPGLIPFHPGDEASDWWYDAGRGDGGYGEIQEAHALRARALHEHATSIPGPTGQTIDRRAVSPPDLSVLPRVILEVSFYGHTSDPNTRNSYAARFSGTGGPHPGYEIFGLGVFSGNGPTRQEAGLNLALGAFNGVDNNVAVPVTVGQGLAWDTWHDAKLVIDQAADEYVSLSVDGITQDLRGHRLPRSQFEGQWLRGQLLETLSTEIAPSDNYDDRSADDIYWDNVSVTADCGLDLSADLDGDCRVDLRDLAILAAQWLQGP